MLKKTLATVVIAFSLSVNSTINKSSQDTHSEIQPTTKTNDYITQESWVEMSPIKGDYTLKDIDVGESVITPDLEIKLLEIVQMKNYAIDKLGLLPSKNYSRYRKEKPQTIYQLYIIPKNEMPETLKKRWINIKNKTEYRKIHEKAVVIHSRKDNLKDEEEFYKQVKKDGRQKYDIIYRTINDFSSKKGCDITDRFLSYTELEKAGTIFHEFWHSSIQEIIPDNKLDRRIDEAVAEVVQMMGAIEYSTDKYGPSNISTINAINQMRNWKNYGQLIRESHEKLKEIYALQIPEQSKIILAENLFKKAEEKGYHINNARVWESIIYKKYEPLVLKAYEESGSVQGLVELMYGAPTTEDEAVKYLEEYINE